MATCDTCGNTYDKTFEIRTEAGTFTFDSFECAIHKLAPTCEICGVRVIGHGAEAGNRIFCCAHCAERAGESGMRDRI